MSNGTFEALKQINQSSEDDPLLRAFKTGRYVKQAKSAKLFIVCLLFILIQKAGIFENIFYWIHKFVCL